MTTLTNGLVSFWKFNGDGNDSVGISNMTGLNSPSYDTGVVSQATLLAQASSQAWYRQNATEISRGDNSYSFSVWFYKTAVNEQGIFGKYISAVNGEFYLRSLNGGALLYRCVGNTGTSKSASSTATINNSTWYHVYCYYDQPNHVVGIRVNDTTEDTTSTVGWVHNGYQSANFAMGCRDNGSGGYQNFLDGKIDCVGLWGRLLTPTEVTSLYNAGTGLEYPFEVIPTVGPFITSRRDKL